MLKTTDERLQDLEVLMEEIGKILSAYIRNYHSLSIEDVVGALQNRFLKYVNLKKETE